MKFQAKRSLLFILFFVLLPGISSKLYSQTATLKGTITDSVGKPLEFAAVSVVGGNGTNADANGKYRLTIPADKVVTIGVAMQGYTPYKHNVMLDAGSTQTLNVILYPTGGILLDTGTFVDYRHDHLPIKDFPHLPSETGDISAALKFVGAFSANELSTQYSVRGGNFDENLVYVNGVEVYRPVLTRAGQQEGLSFVNTDMVDDVYFSTGGFEAKYGDKMSSVLDITYREPTHFGASFSASLLGASVEVEDASKDLRFSWQLGVRNKTNRYLLRSLDTKGDYVADFTDVQTSIIYHFNENCWINYLGNYAVNKYNLVPSTRETDFGTLNNALRFTVYFDGQELNKFNTIFNAVSFNVQHGRWHSKAILSSFNTYESETYDVQGQYYIDQLEADFGKPTFGQVAFNRGVGTFLNHGRNYLNAWVNSAEAKTSYFGTNTTWNFGVRYQNEWIQDDLSEWNYVDSAGYSVPYQPYNSLDLQDVIKGKHDLNSDRVMGYAQFKWIKTLKDTSDLSLTFGVRGNYWTLNGQTIAEPRLQLEYTPNHKNVTYRLATGLYDQPPFYKELKDFSGNIHTDVKAQVSLHAIAGADVNFTMWGRPFRFITEGYYKYLDQLIPYEVNDVRIRYYGANLSHGYAYGLDARMNGEFVEGVDSWVNLSLLRTREDLYNDNYYIYLNSDGDTIVPGYTFNNVKTDSILQTPGYIPRPTDQLLTFALYFQDDLPTLEDCKMNLGLILGSGLPFGPPTHERYKAVFRMPPYRRVDIGFSYQIIKEEKPLSDSSAFHFIKSLWVGAEIYNLLQVQNTISYYWVKDVTGRSYAIPNYLTNRQISIRLIAKF